MAHEQPAPAAVSRQLGSAFTRHAFPLAVVLATAGWLEWVRLGVRTPSLIDDWYAITYSRTALHALLQGHYSSAPIDFSGRYRPAYSAVWNYVQWHLIGSPSITTAAAWGVLRVTVFLVAVWLLTVWLSGRQSMRGHPLLWLPPLAVAMTPAIAVDLARHSPSEPMMVAGLIIGLALTGAGVRGLLVDPRPSRLMCSISAIGIGYPIYLYGVYSKETSIALLVFVPFFLKWLGPAIRQGMLESRRARYLFASTAVLIVAPLLHLGIRLAISVSGGRDPYPDAHFSLARRFFVAGVLPLFGAPGPLGTLLWLVGAPVAIVVAAVMARKHETDSWLVAGILATGFAMSAFALARGDTPSRYYIPWLVAVAAVAMKGLARSNVGLQIAAAGIVIVIAFSETRGAMADWVRTERSGSTAVEMAKGVVRAGCPLYLAKFDVERRVAIPLLLGFGAGTPIKMCTPGSDQAYALSWQEQPLPRRFASRCESGWQALEVRNRVTLYRCHSFAGRGFLDQDAASGMPHVEIVHLRVPPHAPDPRTLFQPSSR
jgi:hypothetical protein